MKKISKKVWMIMMAVTAAAALSAAAVTAQDKAGERGRRLKAKTSLPVIEADR